MPISKSYYTKAELISAIKSTGITKGDIIFSHSNIGFLGFPNGNKDPDYIFKIILDSFLDVIGREGTFIVPTFTYSFPKHKIFDATTSKSTCGYFTEMFRKLSNSYRSNDPCVSVSAIGKYAKDFTKNIPVNAYAENSFFDRFYKSEGKICNINLSSSFQTFLHYIERKLNVPYRFDKAFNGIIIKNSKKEKKESIIWVRYLTKGTQVNINSLGLLAEQIGLCKNASIGRGFISTITAKDTFDIIKKTLPRRPWFLTEAEKLGIIPDLKNAKR